MRTLRKYGSVLLLLTVLIGFTSCEDDETIFDEIVGRTWVGDLGFESNDSFRAPLGSSVYFGSDGFGDDQLYYLDDTGDPYGNPLRLQWRVADRSIFIDYGRVAPLRELRDVYVRNGRLNGSLYIDDGIDVFYYGEVELRMQ